RADERANVAAAGDGRKKIDVTKKPGIDEGLQDAEVEAGGANAAAGQRQPGNIFDRVRRLAAQLRLFTTLCNFSQLGRTNFVPFLFEMFLFTIHTDLGRYRRKPARRGSRFSSWAVCEGIRYDGRR